MFLSDSGSRYFRRESLAAEAGCDQLPRTHAGTWVRHDDAAVVGIASLHEGHVVLGVTVGSRVVGE